MTIAYRRGDFLQPDNDLMVFERCNRRIECGDVAPIELVTCRRMKRVLVASGHSRAKYRTSSCHCALLRVGFVCASMPVESTGNRHQQ